MVIIIYLLSIHLTLAKKIYNTRTSLKIAFRIKAKCYLTPTVVLNESFLVYQ